MKEKKAIDKKSFISDARRAQIRNAAIMTLDEIGYDKASLAQIARRAEISTALISYHFKDKTDLMNHVLEELMSSTASYVLEATSSCKSSKEKLHNFILSSVEYQGIYPEHYNALLEIIFNARTPESVPYYKLDNGEEEPLIIELKRILTEGQNSGEFRRFNVEIMANAIQGAIVEYIGNLNMYNKIDHKTYGQELIGIFDSAILK